MYASLRLNELNEMFMQSWDKLNKFVALGILLALSEGNPPVTSGFSSQSASSAKTLGRYIKM